MKISDKSYLIGLIGLVGWWLSIVCVATIASLFFGDKAIMPATIIYGTLSAIYLARLK